MVSFETGLVACEGKRGQFRSYRIAAVKSYKALARIDVYNAILTVDTKLSTIIITEPYYNL